jgi:hypothetical protein
MSILDLAEVKDQLEHDGEYGYPFYSFRPDQLNDLAEYIAKKAVEDYKASLVPSLWMTKFEDWWSGYFHEINSQKATALAAWKAAKKDSAAEIEILEELIMRDQL